MSFLWGSLACLMPLSLCLSFLLLAGMGRRMGEALRMPRLYLFYPAAAALAIVAALAMLAAGAAGWWESGSAGSARGAALLVLLPLAASACMAAYPTMRYWRWIWPELRSSRPSERGGGDEKNGPLK